MDKIYQNLALPCDLFLSRMVFHISISMHHSQTQWENHEITRVYRSYEFSKNNYTTDIF